MEVRTGIPRRRLALIALVEVVVVGACAVSVWQVWQSRQTATPAAPPGTAEPAPASTPTAAATPIALPPDGSATQATGAPSSGGETASTLLQHLTHLNGLVGTIEQAETGVLQILIPGSVWYLKNVLVPRVEAALGGH